MEKMSRRTLLAGAAALSAGCMIGVDAAFPQAIAVGSRRWLAGRYFDYELSDPSWEKPHLLRMGLRYRSDGTMWYVSQHRDRFETDRRWDMFLEEETYVPKSTMNDFHRSFEGRMWGLGGTEVFLA